MDPLMILSGEHNSAGSPLFAMMGPKNAYSDRKTRKNRKKHYSGKKKAHTVKNILLVNEELFHPISW